MNGIDIKNITRSYKLPDRKNELIFEKFNMTVQKNEIVGIFGPNGCGKTTLLNMTAGIIKPDSGDIFIFNKKPSENRIAYIFQDYRSSLFPWLTVRENILFPLTIKGISKKEKNNCLEKLIDLIKIPFNINKYPYQLSGGQQQYVSIMRCLISNPAVMLIDEPFSALDYSNSIWLMEKISIIFQTVTIPSMIVAHDIEHLVYLADKVYFLSGKPVRIIGERLISFHGQTNKVDFNSGGIREFKEEMMHYYSKKEACSWD